MLQTSWGCSLAMKCDQFGGSSAGEGGLLGEECGDIKDAGYEGVCFDVESTEVPNARNLCPTAHCAPTPNAQGPRPKAQCLEMPKAQCLMPRPIAPPYCPTLLPRPIAPPYRVRDRGRGRVGRLTSRPLDTAR